MIATPAVEAWQWKDAGAMSIARDGTHAVLLGDGRVLVVGTALDGEQVPAGSVRTDLWDPATNEWHKTDSLNKPRGEFIAQPLPGGGALVAGGLNQANQSYSSAYAFDSGAGTWSKVGLMDAARTTPASALLPDGRVLVAGGYLHFDLGAVDPAPEAVLSAYHPTDETRSSGVPRLTDVEAPPIGAALATAEIFDPATGTWSGTGPLKLARYGARAVTLTDGRILVVGSQSGNNGVAVDGDAPYTAEIFDPAKGRFHLTGRLPDIDRKSLEKHGASNANKVPEYAPDLTDVGSLVALDDGGAILIGQSGLWSHAGEIVRSFRFDATSETWTEIGQTYVFVGEPTRVVLETKDVRRLAGAMAAKLPDGTVLVAGGDGKANADGSTAVAERYDPVTDTWSPLPPMPEARAGGAVTVLADGSVLIVGGHDDTADGRTALASATRFLPAP